MRALSHLRLVPLVLVVLTACGSSPKPNPPPELAVKKSWFPGLPQEGSKILQSDFEVDNVDAYEVHIVGWLLSKPVPGKFLPVAECTRLILAMDGDRPVLPSTELAQGGMVAVGPAALEAHSWIEIGGAKSATRFLDSDGVLPKGLTVQFEVTLKRPPAGVRGENRSLSFCVSRASDNRLTVSILSQQIEPTENGQSTVKLQEILVLDRAPEPGKKPLFLSWQARMARLTAEDVGIYIEVRPGVRWGLKKALAECEESLRTLAREADAKGSVVSDREAQAIDLASALESIALVPKRRAMLVNQAEKTKASLALDFGLSGDEPLLASYFLRLLPILKAHKAEELTPEKVGWILEREAWRDLLLQLEEQPSPPAMLALGLRHAGELANYTGMLNTILAESRGLREFQRNLLMENRAILSSNLPAPRIRSYVWLESQGDDLLDYAPLGSSDDRRKAYEALVKKWEAEDQKK